MTVRLWSHVRSHDKRKWYSSTSARPITIRQDRLVTCSAKLLLKNTWRLNLVFLWGHFRNENQYISTSTRSLASKCRRLMLKIGKNWCGRFIKKHLNLKFAKKYFYLCAEFTSLVYITFRIYFIGCSNFLISRSTECYSWDFKVPWFLEPPAMVGKVLWIRVCPAICPSFHLAFFLAVFLELTH